MGFAAKITYYFDILAIYLSIPPHPVFVIFDTRLEAILCLKTAPYV